MTDEEKDQFERLMSRAVAGARLAESAGDVPVGAVIARGGRVIASGFNRRTIDADPTAHAEIIAIRSAAEAVGDWRLSGCTLAVTLEPCAMCAGAIVMARIDRLIYGAVDPKAGAVETLYRICSDERLNHRVEIVSGVLADECGRLLTDFFSRQRKIGKK